MTSPKIVAVVLAGGASSRFGSDKLAASLDGRPLLHHALEAVGAVVDRIVVVIAPEAPVPSIPDGLASRVVVARDTAAHAGPLAGMGVGLATLLATADTPVRDEAPHITGVGATDGVTAGMTAGATAGRDDGWDDGWDGVVLVVGGDMPTLVPAVLRLLATTLAEDPSLAVMTLAASDPAPLPMAVRPNAARAAIDAILASGGRRSLLALLEVLPSATLPADAWRPLDPTAATLRDVDTPGDLQAT